MIVSTAEMQAAECRLFTTGVEAETLMDEAGARCAKAIIQFFPKRGRLTLFCGRGNNGGDTYVIGTRLKKQGWFVETVESHASTELTPLSQKKRIEFLSQTSNTDFHANSHHVVVDGLLGIGSNGPLRGKIGDLAGEINSIRKNEHATVFAVDLPSGVGQKNGVTADFTLSICEFKSELVADDAVDQVGRLVKIPLPELSTAIKKFGPEQVANSKVLRAWLSPRDFGKHKGSTGRVVIIAGSRGMTGAAVLAGLGALHGGAGLVTIFAEESIYPIVAASAPPEIMVRPTSDFSEVTEFNADVLAIGPGLGPAKRDDILNLILNDPRPAVVDADGLNWLAESESIPKFTHPRLLTPHPGEMSRLFGDFRNLTRDEIATEFSKRTGASILLKGSRSVIANSDETAPLTYNSTGHPGMATGGIGDVLTGLSAALIARKLSPARAAIVGSWLVGRAAEIAIFEDGESAESLSAVMIANRLGRAFRSLKSGDF